MGKTTYFAMAFSIHFIIFIGLSTRLILFVIVNYRLINRYLTSTKPPKSLDKAPSLKDNKRIMLNNLIKEQNDSSILMDLFRSLLYVVFVGSLFVYTLILSPLIISFGSHPYLLYSSVDIVLYLFIVFATISSIFIVYIYEHNRLNLILRMKIFRQSLMYMTLSRNHANEWRKKLYDWLNYCLEVDLMGLREGSFGQYSKFLNFVLFFIVLIEACILFTIRRSVSLLS